MAALSACLVDALGESEPAFQARFKENLEHAYNNIRDMEGSNVAAMEILHWTREFLKELQNTRGEAGWRAPGPRSSAPTRLFRGPSPYQNDVPARLDRRRARR